MKKNKFALLSLMVSGALCLQLCVSCGAMETNNSEDAVSSISEKSEKIHYEPFKISDEGGFNVGDPIDRYYTFHQLIVLLNDYDIPIMDMRGSSDLNVNDGGSVDLDNAYFDYQFDKKQFTEYDINAIGKEFTENDFASLYVETPWEIFTFRASGDGHSFPGMGEFTMSTVRLYHPEFVTEKGIKIGCTPEQIESSYEIVFDNRSYKTIEEDWSISGDVGDYNGFITFVGDDTGVKHMDVGGRYIS